MQIDKNIAVNLKRIRKAKNLSLDMVAEQTGVSKSMLGQIERGESNPTVTTLGKIVEGLKIPFEQLIYERPETVRTFSFESAPVWKEKADAYSLRVLLPYGAGRGFEVYQGRLEPGAVMEGVFRGENRWVYLTVLRGEIALETDGTSYGAEAGMSLCFLCDRDYVCRCVGSAPAQLHMVVSGE